MIEFLKQLPHLEPYGTPVYFIYLIGALLPIFVGLFFKKRFPVYEALVSLAFIVLMLTGTDLKQIYAVLFYLFWQILWVYSYKIYRSQRDNKWVFYLHSFLVVLPLVFVKVQPAIDGTQSWMGFLGISYLTFRAVGMIIEMRDGTLKEFSLWEFLRFLLFMPTFSSGPIDRFKRFNEDYLTIPDRDELLDMLEQSVKYIMLGFLYKFILAHIFGHLLLGHVKTYALLQGGIFNLGTLGVMYVFGLDLFFDFAGYSLIAVGTSYIFGVHAPDNFNKPFLSKDMKEFWTRWHISLSRWFGDYIFSRYVLNAMRNKKFKKRATASHVAQMITMTVMGFWHGLTWYYIAYGVYQGLMLVLTDEFTKKSKIYKKYKKEKWFQRLQIVITFNIVCFGMLIFSGFLDFYVK